MTAIRFLDLDDPYELDKAIGYAMDLTMGIKVAKIKKMAKAIGGSKISNTRRTTVRQLVHFFGIWRKAGGRV